MVGIKILDAGLWCETTKKMVFDVLRLEPIKLPATREPIRWALREIGERRGSESVSSLTSGRVSGCTTKMMK